MPKQKKDTSKAIYDQNSDILAYFIIEDGKISMDVNDEKISIPEIMVILSNTITEYTKIIAANSTTN